MGGRPLVRPKMGVEGGLGPVEEKKKELCVNCFDFKINKRLDITYSSEWNKYKL